MDVRVAEDHKRFDAWLVRHDQPPFTQSSAWAAILSEEGKQVELLEVFGEQGKVAQAVMIYTSLFLGWSYAFCPKGPTLLDGTVEDGVYAALKTYCLSKPCMFVRIEPVTILPRKDALKVVDINPRTTVYLDLHTKADDLLTAMHPKTRYNIRLAEKKELTVSQEKNVDVLYDLLMKTGERDTFKLHSRKHYEKIVASPLSRQFTVLLGGKPITAALFIGCGNTYTYVYGASDYEHRALMAPYFLQWKAIMFAQEQGYRWYDFFGIAPVEMVRGEYTYDEKHQYAGVTRFKLGFGGQTREVPGTYDLLISPLRYRMYEFLRRIRRKF